MSSLPVPGIGRRGWKGETPGQQVLSRGLGAPGAERQRRPPASPQPCRTQDGARRHHSGSAQDRCDRSGGDRTHPPLRRPAGPPLVTPAKGASWEPGQAHTQGGVCAVRALPEGDTSAPCSSPSVCKPPTGERAAPAEWPFSSIDPQAPAVRVLKRERSPVNPLGFKTLNIKLSSLLRRVMRKSERFSPRVVGTPHAWARPSPRLRGTGSQVWARLAARVMHGRPASSPAVWGVQLGSSGSGVPG